MAQTIVDLTLQTVRDLVVEETKFLGGFSGQVEAVQKEITRLRSFLEDVDRRKHKDETIRNFSKEIKNLCYRIEDAVDGYASEVTLRRPKKGDFLGILKRIGSAPLQCYNVHQTGTEIDGILSDIRELMSRMEQGGIIKISILGGGRSSDKVDQTEGWLRRTYGQDVDKDFVGMQKDIRLLVSELMRDDGGKDGVVSIWGMGGLGKTTLAEKIYHDTDLRKHGGFIGFAWVCVSKNCDPKSVFQDMLEQLSSLSKVVTSGMGDTKLGLVVHSVMKSKKCLIVLDDVWKLDDWICLDSALRIAGTESKVLITTRNQHVADVGFAHHLDVLTPDEALELLRKKTFPAMTVTNQGSSSELKALEEIGRKMVRKCGYLPLAIKVLGGILRQRETSEWEAMNETINSYLNLADDGNKNWGIKQVLSLSYGDLPYHIKPCFLYLSRFGEDENITAEELYLFWMAEGIVSPENQKKDETLMDLAKRYLRELASRSLVEVHVDEITAPDEIQSCRLHDLLRDLSIDKACEEEYLEVVNFRDGKGSPFDSLSSINYRLRRLAVYIKSNQDLNGSPLTEESTQRRLRSLLLHVPSPTYLFQDLVMTVPPEVTELRKFQFLRVLAFHYVKFGDEKLLQGIGKLMHLRLLAFLHCHLLQLPSNIGDLQYLQTLDLETRSFLVIPDVLHKLKKLKYLNVINAGGIEGKLSLIGLDDLEVLHGFSSYNCSVADLFQLKRLRRLKAEIYGNNDLSEFVDSIEGDGTRRLDMSAIVICDTEFLSAQGVILLKKLFKCRNVHSLSTPGIVQIGKLPEYEPGFFPNLTVLNLQGGEISEDPMGTLEKLPKLRKLIFVEKSFVGEEMICHADGFRQLRHLELNRLSNLEKWTIEKGSMPCLSFLKLSSCCKLDAIPDGIRFINTLQTLEIADMNTNFQRRIGGDGEDFEKVSHVKSIFIHF